MTFYMFVVYKKIIVMCGKSYKYIYRFWKKKKIEFNADLHFYIYVAINHEYKLSRGIRKYKYSWISDLTIGLIQCDMYNI